MDKADQLKSEIAEKMSLDIIRYSQVWEDHILLEKGLAIEADDDVLSICSAGCNVLALVLCEPKSVTAIDMSASQIALLELKLAGINELSHQEFTSLMGAESDLNAVEVYNSIRRQLSPKAKSFWDTHTDDIKNGIIHCGRLENYIRGFRHEHEAAFWPSNFITQLFQSPSLDVQRSKVQSEGLTPKFEEAFRVYFGEKKMAEQGRDPAQFLHVTEGDVGRYLYERFVYACTEMPLAKNFYMEHFLTSNYADLAHGPPYLNPDNFGRLKSLTSRVQLCVGQVEEHLRQKPKGEYSKGNFSDIFEYMSQDLSDGVFTAIADSFRPGGRIAYWNFLVPRKSPERLRPCLKPLKSVSKELWDQDRSWFYRDFVVEQLCE